MSEKSLLKQLRELEKKYEELENYEPQHIKALDKKLSDAREKLRESKWSKLELIRREMFVINEKLYQVKQKQKGTT